MDVDEEFSHGGDDGAFVGLAPVAQSLDIGGNNGVAVRCGVGGHVDASTHLGATADEGAPAGELAASPSQKPFQRCQFGCLYTNKA